MPTAQHTATRDGFIKKKSLRPSPGTGWRRRTGRGSTGLDDVVSEAAGVEDLEQLEAGSTDDRACRQHPAPICSVREAEERARDQAGRRWRRGPWLARRSTERDELARPSAS